MPKVGSRYECMRCAFSAYACEGTCRCGGKIVNTSEFIGRFVPLYTAAGAIITNLEIGLGRVRPW